MRTERIRFRFVCLIMAKSYYGITFFSLVFIPKLMKWSTIHAKEITSIGRQVSVVLA